MAPESYKPTATPTDPASTKYTSAKNKSINISIFYLRLADDLASYKVIVLFNMKITTMKNARTPIFQTWNDDNKIIDKRRINDKI